MAKHPFEVPPADGNPIDRRKLPNTIPTIRFPARFRAHEDFWPWLLMVLSWSVGLATIFLVAFWVLAKTNHVFELRVVGLSLLALHAGSAAWTDRGFRLLPTLACLPILVLLTPVAADIPWWVPLFYVIFCEAFRFRSHYLAHATSGFYDDDTVKLFYRTKRSTLKKSLVAVVPAVLDAFRSYALYNFHHCRSPGLFQSPAGPTFLRWIRVMVLPFVAIFVLPSQLVQELKGGIPSIHYLLLATVLTFAAWFLACGLSVVSFASEAYALKKTQMHPILWQQLKNRLTTSSDPIEKASIYLGSVDLDGAPILLPVEQGFPHIRLTGSTGSGKTAYLLSLIDQIIARRDSSILYIDLKATSFEPLAAIRQFELQSQLKKQPRIPIQYFTPDLGLETFVYDVFSQPWWKVASVPQKSATVLSVASLIYSRAYGSSYFTDAAYHVVQYVFSRNPQITSWKELEQGIQDAFRYAKPHEIPPSTKIDCTHVFFIVARLAQIAAINQGPNWSTAVRNAAISFDAMFASPIMLYASLSQMRHPLLAGELGRLLAGSALHAAAAMHPSQRKTKLIIVIDEWQAMVADSLEVFLTQSRSLGIGVILANQNAAQLKQGSIDLTSVVQGNTSIQCWFQVTDDIGRTELNHVGGKYRRWAMSYTRRRYGNEWHQTQTAKETIEDRLHSNIISEVGSDKARFFIRMTNNAGYAAFNDLIFVARMAFNISPSDYSQMVHSNWPKGNPNALVNTVSQAVPAQGMAFPSPHFVSQPAIPLTAAHPPQAPSKGAANGQHSSRSSTANSPPQSKTHPLLQNQPPPLPHQPQPTKTTPLGKPRKKN